MVIAFNLVQVVRRVPLVQYQLLKCDKFQGTFVLRGVRTANAVVPEPVTTPSDEEKKEWTFNPDLRFKFPEFLPHPWMKWRHPVKEKIERADMLKRRKHLEIPEFYVGSVLAVISSNPHAPQKTSRFVGICILRQGTGLNSRFMLRNIVEKQGIDMLYELYDPLLQSIDVLRLEKRLDSDLLYLRDAEDHHSTFPFDMEPEYLAEGEPIPVNDTVVKLKPKPWRVRYEVRGYKGLEVPLSALSKRNLNKMKKNWKRPIENDLMWHYRATIPEDEQREIFAEVASDLHQLTKKKTKIKKKIEFVAPKKNA